MLFEKLIVGPLSTNCYVVGNEPVCAIIDPGGSADEILEFVESRGLSVDSIAITHGHADHILSVGEISASWPEAKIYIHPDESGFLTNPSENLSYFMGEGFVTRPATDFYRDGDKVELGGVVFEVLHVPGHSPGGVCLFNSGDFGRPLLIAGDTVFQDSIGRTDFPHSSHNIFISKIKEKILTLPAETIILPGHGPSTTVGQEREYNPFLV